MVQLELVLAWSEVIIDHNPLRGTTFVSEYYRKYSLHSVYLYPEETATQLYVNHRNITMITET